MLRPSFSSFNTSKDGGKSPKIYRHGERQKSKEYSQFSVIRKALPDAGVHRNDEQWRAWNKVDTI